MKVTWVTLIAAQALLVCGAVSAGDEDLPWAFNAPRGEGYSIDLVSVEPMPGTPLVRGDTISFQVTVSYSLTVAARGQIILVFQDEKNRSATAGRPQTVREVTQGEGTVTLTESVVVPAKAKELRLFIPLAPDGLTTTTGEITLRYPIVKSSK